MYVSLTTLSGFGEPMESVEQASSTKANSGAVALYFQVLAVVKQKRVFFANQGY